MGRQLSQPLQERHMASVAAVSEDIGEEAAEEEGVGEDECRVSRRRW